MRSFLFTLGSFAILLSLGGPGITPIRAQTPPAAARTFYVSPQGSDAHPGTLERPFATLRRACEHLQPGDRCFLREGVYREVLRPLSSGTAHRPITFANYQNEKVVLSGTEIIQEIRSEADGTHTAPMNWSLQDGNQVFADGIMLTEACWPNPGEQHLFQPIRAAATGGSERTLVCPDIPGSADDWKGAQLWCAGGAAWICWTSLVTDFDKNSHTLTFDKAQSSWYLPTRGSRFSLRGVRAAMDQPGEWIHEPATQRLRLILPPARAGSGSVKLEAKCRTHAIDLSGRSHLHLRGLQLFAAGLRTDAKSSHIVCENIKGSHLAHSYQKDLSSFSGIMLFGKHHLLLNCDFGHSSSSVLTVDGEDHRIINCHLHHGGYAGLWRGTVSLSGRRILFSHNTVQHAGRDLINTHGLMESLVQYNDVSEAGWLTKDLGMFYGHNTDYANTRFCYNLVHDNHADHCAMGIYFDHLSHNVIVDHNVIWNVSFDPVRVNNPSYGALVSHNSCWKTGSVTTFDHSHREDLFASRFEANIFNQPLQLPPHVATINNLIAATPPYVDPAQHDFRLVAGSSHRQGAYSQEMPTWRAGCDLQNPPQPLPTYAPPSMPWMNGIKNACFEYGTLESWQLTGQQQASLVRGNGWGNHNGQKNQHATGTSKYELQLGPGCHGIEQVVRGLFPNTSYTLSAWARITDHQDIVLGVHNHGAAAREASHRSPEWQRLTVSFRTGPQSREATIYLRKPAAHKGFAWADNFTLPLSPANHDSP